VKELEENVSQVSRQCDTLNVEVEQATARSDALKDEVTTLKGAVQEKDAALEAARQEIEALKATIGDKDNAFLRLERTCGGFVMRLWACRPISRVSVIVTATMLRALRWVLICLSCFRAGEGEPRGPILCQLLLEPPRGRDPEDPTALGRDHHRV
jgi:hypothetical protein